MHRGDVGRAGRVGRPEELAEQHDPDRHRGDGQTGDEQALPAGHGQRSRTTAAAIGRRQWVELIASR